MKADQVVVSIIVFYSFALNAGPAAAAKLDGFYGSASVGSSAVEDLKMNISGPGSAEAEIALDSGLSIKSAGGYDFGIGRADIEIDFSQNRVRSLELLAINGATPALSLEQKMHFCQALAAARCTFEGNRFSFAGDRVKQFSGLANIWVDLPIRSPIVPYVGGGIGISAINLDGERNSNFAWQVGAGLGYAVSDKLILAADLRHREAAGAKHNVENAGMTEFGKIKSNSFSVSLRSIF